MVRDLVLQLQLLQGAHNVHQLQVQEGRSSQGHAEAQLKLGAPGGCKSLQRMNSRCVPGPRGSENSVLEACDPLARHRQAASDVSSCLQTLSLTHGQNL